MFDGDVMTMGFLLKSPLFDLRGRVPPQVHPQVRLHRLRVHRVLLTRRSSLEQIVAWARSLYADEISFEGSAEPDLMGILPEPLNRFDPQDVVKLQQFWYLDPLETCLKISEDDVFLMKPVQIN